MKKKNDTAFKEEAESKITFDFDSFFNFVIESGLILESIE